MENFNFGGDGVNTEVKIGVLVVAGSETGESIEADFGVLVAVSSKVVFYVRLGVAAAGLNGAIHYAKINTHLIQEQKF